MEIGNIITIKSGRQFEVVKLTDKTVWYKALDRDATFHSRMNTVKANIESGDWKINSFSRVNFSQNDR